VSFAARIERSRLPCRAGFGRFRDRDGLRRRVPSPGAIFRGNAPRPGAAYRARPRQRTRRSPGT